MKKTLLSIFGALAVSSAVGQASASWSITQNAAWPKVSTGVRLLSAVDANVVWAHGYDGTAGNTSRNYSWFTRTINGGTSWASGNIYQSTVTPIIGDTNSFKIASLEGVDANTCWVASYLKAGQNKGAIHRTTNGGVTWQNMTAAGMYTNAASFCNIVTFVTPLIGITMGDPHPGIANEYEIWRTTDGGNTWSLVPGANIPNPSSVNEFGLTGVYTKLGSNNIWFGTNEGRIFRSTDGGLTWNVSTLDPSSVGINEIAFTTPLNGYCWLFDASQSLAQYNTTDGGATWTLIPVQDPNLGLNNMGAIPGTSDYASCGAGTTNQIISYSSNAGVTWTDWGSTTIQYLTVDFVNNTTGWAGGFSDPTTPGIGGIYKYSGPAITSPAAPTAAFSAPPVLCLSTGSTVLNNTSTGNPAPTYSWTSSPAAVFSSPTATNPTVTFATAQSYTLTLTAVNATGTNVATQVVLVQACTAPTAAFTSAANACAKVTYTVNNTTTGAPAPTYTWSTNPTASVTISNANAAAPSFTFGAAGVYSITVVAMNASGSNTAVNTVTVAPCPPAVSFSVPAMTCVTTNTINTTNTTASTITPISYSWTASPAVSAAFSNSTAPAPSITFTAAGIYTITLTAGNISGTAQTTQTVNVDPCAGVYENAGALAFISVYPNPSNGVFSVSNSVNNDNINYTVTNILGSTVVSGKFNNSKNVDLSAQSKGIYFITFESNGNKITKKIIIE